MKKLRILIWRNVYKGKDFIVIIKMVIKNKSAVKLEDWKLLLGVAVFVSIALAVLVSAGGGEPGYNVTDNETVAYNSIESGINYTNAYFKNQPFVLNISINNTFSPVASASGGANVTELNLTLPLNFNFTVETNGSEVQTQLGALTFSNITMADGTNNLTWYNETGMVANASVASNETYDYWVTLTVNETGMYNVTLTLGNGTDVVRSNITFLIDDRHVPMMNLTLNDSLTTHLNATAQEDLNFQVNISINNTNVYAAAGSNATELNITLPSGVSFVAASNGTAGAYITSVYFSNTSTVLSWYNETFIANTSGTENITSYFWATLNATTPGIHNLTVTVMNASGAFNLSNITIYVNDTTAPSAVTWAAATFANYSNMSRTSIVANVSITDNARAFEVAGFLGDINVSVYNADHVIVTSSVNTSRSKSNFYVNLSNATGFPDGVYYLNVTNLSDSHNNTNVSSQGFLRKITLDTTAPSISSFSCTPGEDINEGEVVTCTCLVTDITSSFAGSGVKTTTYNTSMDTTNTGTRVEYCVAEDWAGNNETTSLSFEIYSSGAAPNGGGSSGGSGTPTYTKTVVVSDEQLETGHSAAFKAKERARVKVSGVNHYVGVDTVSASTVRITVSSTPQEATLSIGDERKFDVNADGTYDLSVTLNSITGTNADLTIKAISEAVTVATEAAQADADTAATEAAGTPAGGDDVVEEASKTWIWIVVVVVVLIIGGVIVWKKRG